MTDVGTVAWVEGGELGSQTAVATDIGTDATHLVVVDVADFLSTVETAGGWLDIGQAGMPLVFAGAVLSDDLTSGTITLAEPLAVDVDEGVRVDLWTADSAVVAYTAGVLYAGIPEPVDAVIPHHFVTHLNGERAIGAQVTLDVVDGALTIVDVPNRTPSVHLGYAADDAMNPNPWTAALDTYPEEVANRLPPSTIQSGDMNADVRVTGSWRTGGTGGRGSQVSNDQGSFNLQPDGAVRKAELNDPDQRDIWGGNVNAPKLSSQEASLSGVTTVENDSSIVFGSAVVSPPVSPPSFVNTWQTAIYGGPHKPWNKVGFTIGDSAYAYTLIRRTGDRPPPDVVARFIVDSGEYSGDTFKFSTVPGAIASIAWSLLLDRLITLEWSGTAWQVNYWDLTSGEFVLDPTPSWVWTDGDAPAGNGAGGNRPAISCRTLTGADHILVAQSAPDGSVNIWPYDDAVLDVLVTTGALEAGGLAGVADTIDTCVLAFETQIIDGDGVPALTMVDLPTGGYSSLPVGWNNAQAAGVARFESDIASGFYYLSRSDHSIMHHHAVADGGPKWGGHGWYKISTGHETPLSPPVRFTKISGSSLIVSSPDLPATADAITVYIGEETVLDTPPANADMWLQTVPLFADRTSLLVSVIVTSASANPVTVGTLMGTLGGGAYKSDGTTLLLDGAGNGEIYDLIAAGGGGGMGGVDIDCGTASASGVDIDCGVA